MKPPTMKRRLNFLRLSSQAPGGSRPPGLSKEESQKLLTAEELDGTLQLLFYASRGKLDGVERMLNGNVNLDSSDYDGRTALHVASCEDRIDVVKLLLQKGASVNAEDRWGSTPLADAQHYGNIEICNLLGKHGGKLAKNARNSIMRISRAMVPEYEIDQSKLNFITDQSSRKGDLYRAAIWQGTKVWVNFLPGTYIAANDQLVRRFKDELALLVKLRHPNVVQFLGAVTQTSPMMIVTEFLSGGDLKAYMEDRNRDIDAAKVVSFALDIARGLNYLHEYKPEPIIHCDLEPSNLLVDESSGHIKVANFGLSQSIGHEYSVEDCVSAKHQGSFSRYMAPEIFDGGKLYDQKVDVYSFGIILQEMLEGCPPFPGLQDPEVAQAYFDRKRPSFKHGGRNYPPLVKELIEDCWDQDPSKRPCFGIIIQRLEHIQGSSGWKTKLKSFLIRQISS